MNYFVYDALTTLAVPPAAAWVAMRSRHRPLLARFSPVVPEGMNAPFWVHACSVGELSVARPVIAALIERYPDAPTVLTVSTVTAWDMASKDPAGAALAWFPIDQRTVVARFFERLKPRALLLMETEIWPNVLREAERRGVPTLVLNARLSDKHFARYKRNAPFFQTVFSRITHVVAQHPTYADRFTSLGVDRARVTVTGNIKFDNLTTAVDEAKLKGLREQCGLCDTGPIVVFGSTRPGDEALAAACWRTWKDQFPDARLIVAPRHRQRLQEALSAFTDPVMLRSRIVSGERVQHERVLFVDTLGELVDFYALATVAIIGGSFYPGVNGHNPLEPAALGVPTVFGPYMSNFIDPAEVLINAQAAIQVESPDALESTVSSLLRSPARRAALSSAARGAIAQNTGALARTLDIVDSVLLKSARAT